MSAVTGRVEPRAPRARRSFPLGWVVRALISALVLVAVFRVIPVHDVWTQALRVRTSLWLAAVLAFLAGHAAAAAKWRLLIGPGVRFTHAFQAHLAGLAANLCLPGLAGGDVVRAGLVYAEAEDRSRLVVGSFADRLLDMLGLLAFATVGALLIWQPAYGAEGTLTWFLLASAAGVLLLVLGGAFLSRIAARVVAGRTAESRVGRALLHGIRAVALIAHEPGRLLLCLAISMAVQATFVVINIALADALDVNAPQAAWFFAWSAAKIVAIAPVSLGGLGVREATLARLLVPFGADPAQVIAVGLIWQTVLYVSGLLGALALVLWKPVRNAPGARPRGKAGTT